ncbi:hypothetical protein [Streptomyces sp. NBC_01794]|nr:hypothetical protein OIE54_39550 [Streptomyces sp. NBC_01794]
MTFGVVTNAHRINSGVQLITSGLSDFFLFGEDETEDAGSVTARTPSPE